MVSPRSQVSFAGFYDWTDDGGDVSVSNFYRKIANVPRNKIFNKGNKTWCTDGLHLNPGRMFIRDKADLTKGEKEIIAGIYRNRGDIHRDKNEINRIRCHKDAWLVGKHGSRRDVKGVIDESKVIKIPEGFFSTKLENPMNLSPRNTCYICAKCKDECVYHHSDDFDFDTHPKTDRPGRIAPPSSPDGSPKPLRKFGKPPVPPIKLGQGAITIERGPTFIDSDDISKKKVYMDVFLPKIGTQVPVDDMKTPVPDGSKSPVNLNDTNDRRMKYENGITSTRHDRNGITLHRNEEFDPTVLNLHKPARTLLWSSSRDGSSGE